MHKLKALWAPYLGLPSAVYAIFVAKVINAMGAFVFPMLTLILTDKIGLKETEAGLWISLSGLLFAPANLLGGKLADHFGRKKLIILFESLGVLAYFICAFKPVDMTTAYLLIGAMCLFGAAEPAHNALVADLTTPKNREGAYSLIYMGFNLGFVIGPALGGLLFEKHLFWFFFGDGATGLIAILLFLFFVKETLPKDEEAEHVPLLEKKEGGSIFKVILKRPILLYYALISLGYNFVYAQWGFLFPMQVKQSFSNGATLYGLMASFNGLIVILCTPLITKLSLGVQSLKKICLGGLLYTVGFGMLGFCTQVPLFFISVFIFTIGEIVISISHMPFIANHTPASHRGRMSAILPMLMGIGYTISPFVVGKGLEAFSIAQMWILLGFIGLASALLMGLLSRMDRKNKGRLAHKN